jgi:hypothetical protein
MIYPPQIFVDFSHAKKIPKQPIFPPKFIYLYHKHNPTTLKLKSQLKKKEKPQTQNLETLQLQNNL